MQENGQNENEDQKVDLDKGMDSGSYQYGQQEPAGGQQSYGQYQTDSQQQGRTDGYPYGQYQTDSQQQSRTDGYPYGQGSADGQSGGYQYGQGPSGSQQSYGQYQQYGQGQAGYQQPYGQYQQYGQAPGSRPGNGFGIASMILGILSLVLFCACINVPLAIAAVIFGVIQLGRDPEGKVFSIIGIMTAVLSVIAFVVMIAVMWKPARYYYEQMQIEELPYDDDFDYDFDLDDMPMFPGGQEHHGSGTGPF